MSLCSVRVAVLFHRLGPYHHARLSALANHCALDVIEFSKIDNTYAWATVNAQTAYPVTSLFTDADIDTKHINEIVLQTKNALSQLTPKAVAIPGWSSPAALAALEWCCATRTPSILMSASTEHDEQRIRWKEWIKTRVVRLFSSAVVGGAPHIDYAAALGLPRTQVFAGYDVVDNEYFSIQSDGARAAAKTLRLQHGLPEHYFLASNRFIEKKNLPRLIDAYAAYVAKVGADAWSLVMLGDGPLRSKLMDQVARLRLDDKVIFTGFKQYDELPIYYGLASAYIQASTSEQWGLVVNEAMASGLPVLVSDRCGCAPDLVKNGVNGFTFDPYDINGIVARMLQISGADCDPAAMGNASLEIISKWSPETFATSMMRAVDAALGTPPPKVGWFDRALLWMLMRR
jgi:1,2-diacylglycerol 3-alpha-glucosyltransferase